MSEKKSIFEKIGEALKNDKKVQPKVEEKKEEVKPEIKQPTQQATDLGAKLAAEARAKAQAELGHKLKVEAIAKEVIEGKWGNWPERKTKLEAAGFDYAEVQTKVNELLGVKTEQKVEVKKTVEAVAKEVLEGKWGNGAERKAALEKAGYNYAEVQTKVNELCK